METTNRPAGGDAAARPGGRAYATPVLKIYGDVPAVTNAIDMSGKADGGPNNTRT